MDMTRAAIGLELSKGNRLVVAGGGTGKAFVYDAKTGAPLQEITLTTVTPTFINDVVVTKDGVLHRLVQAGAVQGPDRPGRRPRRGRDAHAHRDTRRCTGPAST